MPNPTTELLPGMNETNVRRDELIKSILRSGNKVEIANAARNIAEQLISFAIAREINAGVKTHSCHHCGNVFRKD